MGHRKKRRRSSITKKKSTSKNRKGPEIANFSVKNNFQSRSDLTIIATALVDWFTKNKRSFFWRKEELSMFQYLVVELMLQKTRAETVENSTKSLIEKYPDPSSVLKADLKDIENALKPLGLSKRRSNHLIKISKSIMEDYNGEVPMDEKSLIGLTGVGPYIANALLCFGGNIRVTVIDSNVVRIITRLFSLPKPSDVRRPGDIALALEMMLPEDSFREFNFALLDLGSLVCLPGKPRCDKCPLSNYCDHLKNIV